jgi:urease accessory protein
MAGVLELLLGDGRTPSGGYAHSGGLEAALADGLAVDHIPEFIRARLRTIGRCEAVMAALACAATTLHELLALDLEAAARTPAEPLRRASGQLGRGLLRTACTWWPSDRLLAAYRTRSSLTPRPVALGAVARACELTPAAATRLSLYDDAAMVAGAAVKLAALDAAVASGWLVSLASELAELATSASTEAADGIGAPSTSTPLLDQRAIVHANTDRRLFVS